MKAKTIRWPEMIPEIKTPRLRVRPITAQDATDYFALNRDPKVMLSYGIPRHQSLAQTQSLIRWMQAEFKKHHFIRWGVEDKATGKLIGDVGFWRFTETRARGEIGAKLLPAYWGSGYMTEAMGAVIRYAFKSMNLQSIECHIELENVGSIRMTEKLGFQRIGVIPSHSYSLLKKDYTDMLLLNLTRPD